MSPGTHPELEIPTPPPRRRAASWGAAGVARARGCVLRGSVPLLGLRSPQSSLRSLRTLPGIGSEEKGMNKRVSLARRGAGGPVPPTSGAQCRAAAACSCSPGAGSAGARNPERRGALAPGAATLPAAWGRPRGQARPARRSPRLLPRAGRSGADAAAPRPRSRRGQPWSENAEPRPGPAPAPGEPCAALGPRHPQWPCGLRAIAGRGAAQ